MDKDIKILIQNNLNSIIQQRFAENKFELSAKKLKDILTQKYGIVIDNNILTDILSNNPHVKDITDDKITLGTETEEEIEDLDSDIHDTAVDQASKDLSDDITFESVADALSNVKTGFRINSSKINLAESNLFYHLHNGAKKAKKDYIVSDIIPNKNLEESVVRCKLDKTCIFIDLPINCFINKS